VPSLLCILRCWLMMLVATWYFCCMTRRVCNTAACAQPVAFVQGLRREEVPSTSDARSELPHVVLNTGLADEGNQVRRYVGCWGIALHGMIYEPTRSSSPRLPDLAPPRRPTQENNVETIHSGICDLHR